MISLDACCLFFSLYFLDTKGHIMSSVSQKDIGLQVAGIQILKVFLDISCFYWKYVTNMYCDETAKESMLLGI